MRQSLLRLREPVAVVLLVVLALRLLLGVVSFVSLSSGARDDTLAWLSRGTYGDNTFALATYGLSYSVLDAVTAVVLVATVASCLLAAPTRHARSLAGAALVLLLLGIVVSLVAAAVWLTSVGLSAPALTDFVRLLLVLPLPALGAVGLQRLLQEQPAAEQPVQPRQIEPVATVEAVQQPEFEAPPDPGNEPTWQPEEASGAAWLTAGDAARGASASGWGRSADRGGWEPAQPAQRPPAQRESPGEPGDR